MLTSRKVTELPPGRQGPFWANKHSEPEIWHVAYDLFAEMSFPLPRGWDGRRTAA
jgi:hypothetical protein